MYKNLDEIYLTDDVERLIILRKRLGLTQYELASELGYTSRYIQSIESGRFPMSRQFKTKLNNYLLQKHKETLAYEKRTGHSSF